jgi:hypothetical protein
MTPQERELIADLFDRLTQLENQPRDPQAERAIAEGLERAPNAIYPLVQTVLVQDEALKAANARIEALEGGAAEAGPGRPSGFLDNMRDALFGRSEPRRGSVPSVQPGLRPDVAPAAQPGVYGQPYAPAPSFLGTAAAAAAGMVGGALLLDGVRSMLGVHRHGPFAATFDELHAGPRPEEGSPWRGGSDELAREAGLDDIGGVPDHGNEGGAPQGFMDAGQDDASDPGEADFADDGGFDDGGDGGLDSA